MKVLLVGGTNDGKVTNVPEGRDTIRLHEKTDGHEPSIGIETYRLMEIYGQDRKGENHTLIVFAIWGMPSIEVFKKLIANYNGQDNE